MAQQHSGYPLGFFFTIDLQSASLQLGAHPIPCSPIDRICPGSAQNPAITQARESRVIASLFLYSHLESPRVESARPFVFFQIFD
jgi:hypothetical protein